MADTTTRRVTAAGLLLVGVLLLIYPAARPYSSETGAEGAAAIASPWWVAAHTSAIVGFIVLALCLLGLARLGPGRPATAMVITGWTALALVLPFYGAETFGLYEIARTARGGDPALMSLVDRIRYGPVQLSLFGAGLIGMIATGVLLAGWGRRNLTPGWSGYLLGVALVAFLPQFFGPPAVRIGHGVLTFVGAVLLARAVLRRPGALSRSRDA